MAQTNGTNGVNQGGEPDYDVIVIGAGFAGIRMIPELRNLNLSFKVYEAGSNVGGTWYWNRYWKERFPRQPEVEEYLNYVVDKFDMRKDIQFNTKVKSAHWDDTKKIWNFETDKGEHVSARYFVSCTGVLSVGRDLPFKGTENFKGESYRSFAWPKEKVDLRGKRVAVIGTGATSVQIIPMVAHDAKTLTVFQRTANHVLPARNHPLTAEQQRDIKARYDEVWQQARAQIFGMHFVDAKLQMMEVDDEKKIRRVLENGWEIGGFRYIFETFADLLTSQKANDVASDFIREKIRSVVQDEETAELLCPDHAIMAKRPPLGHHYYETFNKPHVTLVDVKSNPIKEITEKGVSLTEKDKRTGTDEFEFDVIIYAIGFDAATGAVTNMDLRGVDNRELGEEWSKQLETFLGIGVPGYPNMFMISAPQSPFANLPIVLDNTADWISKVLAHMNEKGYTRMEPTREATEKWCKLLTDVYEATVLPEAATKAGSWYIGANVPGKKVMPLFWFGGVVSYFEICDNEIKNDFPALAMS